MRAGIIGPTIIVALFSGGIGYMGYQKGQAKLSAVERVQASGKRRFVVFNKKQFIRESGALQSALMVGGSVLSALPDINGGTLEATDAPPSVGEDWVVQEEQVFHALVDTCQRVSEIPCPVAGPAPTPAPVPDPTPAPANDPIIPWGVTKIRALEAQALVDSSTVLVCVTDTGSDQNHPDLQGVLAGGISMVPGSSWQDDMGHGTHVAGTIAAKVGNGQDVAGVSQARIYTVKVLDSRGSGMSSWIANGIVACVRAGAKIVSMSLGADQPDPIIKQAVDYATNSGVIIVAAAGNNSGRVGFPAGYPNVVAISATDSSNRLAQFSSRGPEVDYAAPGVDIESLRLGGGTVKMSGTSMACPHAAGVFALALARGRSGIQAVNIGLPPTSQGRGLIDALNTVR